MKIRKHKNNKTFLITSTTRSPVHTETHLTGYGGRTEKRTFGGDVSPVSRVWATGSCKQSVMRAFLFGRDAGNLTTIIREAAPLDGAYPYRGLFTGRLVNAIAI